MSALTIIAIAAGVAFTIALVVTVYSAIKIAADAERDYHACDDDAGDDWDF